MSEQERPESCSDHASKINRVLYLLEGTGKESPGMIQRLNAHEIMLMGRDGEGGIAHKVNVMWRLHIWILCTLSGLVGFWLKAGIESLIK